MSGIRGPRSSRFSRRGSAQSNHDIFNDAIHPPSSADSPLHLPSRSVIRSHSGLHSSFSNKDGSNLKGKNFEFVAFQRRLLSRLGYFGISTCRILEYGPNTGQLYNVTGNTFFGTFMYYILHINVSFKAMFLALLVTNYFGPVEFLDKIASLDYILCTGLVVIGAWMFLLRYPFYEILENVWKILNSIYWKHGCPYLIRAKMERLQKRILATHMVIIFGGCIALMIQYFPDPKYCNFTYSAFEFDNWPLRLLFGMHEFFFMMMAWNGYAGPSSMCMFQGVAISAMLDELNETLHLLYKNEMKAERVFQPGYGIRFTISRNILLHKKTVPDTEYNIDSILFDYKQLMIICNQLNESVAYKTLFLHICGGSQFVSDVFAATHVLRLPGTGFLDVWFYIWDCMSAGFMLLRVYQFMGRVYDSSEVFLETLNEYLTFPNPKRLHLRKIVRTLRLVSLKVGPCTVSTESVLAVLDTMGNYYVCAALW